MSLDRMLNPNIFLNDRLAFEAINQADESGSREAKNG